MFKSFSPVCRCAIVAVFILIFTSPDLCARAKKYEGTIVTKDSTWYESVAFDADTYFKVLVIDTDEGEITVSFTEIEAVYDMEGNDVTNLIMGNNYREGPIPRASLTSEERRVSRIMPWRIAFTAGTGYGVPIGDYYEGIDGGFEFEGNLRIAVSNNYSIRLSVGMTRLAAPDEFYFYSVDPDVVIYDQSINFDAWRYMIGIQQTEFTNVLKKTNFWYFYASIGAVKHKLSVEINTNQGILEGGESITKFATSFGAGAIVKMSDTI